METNIPKVKQVWIPWDQWECVKAGMQNSACSISHDFEKHKRSYADFLSDSSRFRQAAISMTKKWPLSCVNFLTNESINRIAWIGQASACFEIGLSSAYRSGFWLLSEVQQAEANLVAALVLREWIIEHNKIANREVRGDVERQMLFGWNSE